MQRNGKLQRLSVDKTVVFYSPIEDKDDILVRTGIIADNDSMIHAILYAYSKEYVKMDKAGRCKIVEKLKNIISTKLCEKNWSKIINDEEIDPAILLFYQEAITNAFHEFTSAVNNNRVEDSDTYQILLDMMNIRNVFERISPNNSIKETETSIRKKVRNMVSKHLETLGKKLDEKRKKHCLSRAEKLCDYITKQAEKVTFRNYADVSKTHLPKDSSTIGIISDKLSRDIYVLESETRMPSHVFFNDDNITGRKSIVIMNMGNTHFETVGIMDSSDRIRREFTIEEELIKRIYAFLKPRKRSSEGPSLRSENKSSSEGSVYSDHSRSSRRSSEYDSN